jgi:hypothetical protein
MGSIAIALATGQTGFNPSPSGLVQENVTITGSSSSAGDSGTYTSIMKQPQYVIGGDASYSISGQTVTLSDEVGLGNAVTAATVVGIP